MIYNWQFPSVHDNKLWNGTFYRNIKLFKLGTCGNDILYLITKYSHARVITSMQNFRHFVLYFHSRFWYSILPSSELFHDSKWFTLRKRHCGWLNKERQLQIAYILQRLYWKQTTEAHMALNSFLQECCLSIWSQINTVTICFYKQECDGKEKEVSYEHIVNKTRCIR